MSITQIFNTTGDLNYPKILPTLDLNFANSKTIDPRITFTRGSGGTYVDADGLIKYAGINEARFDHDPSTGECKGLLIEETRTNLHIDSTANLLNGGISGLTQGSALIIDPTGSTSNVETWIQDTSTGTHGGYKFYNNTYINFQWSFFVKANGTRKIQVSPNIRDGSASVTLDLTTGLILSGSLTSYSVLVLNNGWIRISVGMLGNRAHGPGINLLDNSGNTSFTGNGTSGIYIWGVQLEQESWVTFPTSYIPTTTSTVTRAADVASITGTNFSSWFAQNSKFTIYMEFLGFKTGSPYSFLFSLSVPGGYYVISRNPNNAFSLDWEYTYTLVYSSLATTDLTSTTVKQKICGALENNTFTLANASAVNNRSTNQYGGTFVFPTGSSSITFGGNCSLTLSRFTYYPTRLPDATLKKITQ